MEEETKKCPIHKVRAGLPPMIHRIASLPVDERGYPVPFFVQWMENGKGVPRGQGQPDFRIVDPESLKACVRESRCWVCGDQLGVHRAYVVGPMCVINRTSAEPPSHVDCAEWSVQGCPFLSRPNMVRREDELTESAAGNVAGFMIKRNPGVTVLWKIRNHLRMFRDGKGGVLFNIGDPEKVTWFKEGRVATNEECIDAINSGIKTLLDVCETPEERNEVMEKRDRLVDSLRRLD